MTEGVLGLEKNQADLRLACTCRWVDEHALEGERVLVKEACQVRAKIPDAVFLDERSTELIDITILV